jgi:Mn-containing catalase
VRQELTFGTVKLVFNLSQGQDERGSWNEPPDFDYVQDPQPHGGMPPAPINPDDEKPVGPKSKKGKPHRSD